MKMPKTITPKTIEQLQKEVNRINYLKNKIEKIQQELTQINDNNSWVRYTSKEMYEELTTDEKIKFAELCQTIMYADK